MLQYFSAHAPISDILDQLNCSIHLDHKKKKKKVTDVRVKFGDAAHGAALFNRALHDDIQHLTDFLQCMFKGLKFNDAMDRMAGLRPRTAWSWECNVERTDFFYWSKED